MTLKPRWATFKVWGKLLAARATTSRLQVELLVTVQLWCYESQEIMKAFRDIIHLLYELDVVSEEAVLYWFVTPLFSFRCNARLAAQLAAPTSGVAP